MLFGGNKERAKEYLEHISRQFGTTAMDHWNATDALEFHNAIAILTDKDYAWSTEIPAESCIAWKCIISRHSEHYMKAETFLADVTRFDPYGLSVRTSKEPIFREFHYLTEEEEGFWPKELMSFYKVVESPYTNMQALIQKVKENKDA